MTNVMETLTNDETSISNEATWNLPRSRPSTTFINMNNLMERSKEYIGIPLRKVLVTTASSITKSTTMPTTVRTTMRTTTTKTTTTTAPPTTTMKNTTTKRQTTVTQMSHIKRRTTVKFNPYIFIASNMKSDRNPYEPKLRKEDIGYNTTSLYYKNEELDDDNTSISKNLVQHEDLHRMVHNTTENGLSHDKAKAPNLLRKTSMLFADDVSFVPLTNSTTTSPVSKLPLSKEEDSHIKSRMQFQNVFAVVGIRIHAKKEYKHFVLTIQFISSA